MEHTMDFQDLRKQKFKTSTEFASVVGISPSCVRKWESGASRPQTKDLRKIADTLGVSVEQLLNCFEN